MSPHFRTSVVVAVLLLIRLGAAGSEPAARKVYADYHSLRLTREHDGALGLWKYSVVGRNSRVANPVVNRNADLIDENGRHELASADYPLVGMQSELDPDYLEYQVLSAKTAGIDGFFVEWGYFSHASESVRRALTTVASRYDFEIGINLCDRWLFTQLPARRPELKERSQLVDEFARNYVELLRTLAKEGPTIRFKGRPVVFLFGDGLAAEEFDRVNRSVASAGLDPACVLIRPQIVTQPGGPDGLQQSWQSSAWFNPPHGFHAGVAGFFGWVPTRSRTDNAELRRRFDRYGTVGDAISYLHLVTAARGSGPRTSSAVPGFDNLNCAGWGNDFSYLARGQGELYRAMWQFNVANAERLDWVFLPTWNDWTEGSQLEPSVEDQGLFLKLTAVAAAKFKGQSIDPNLTTLPLHLFQLRQRLHRLAQVKDGHQSGIASTLDRAALILANRNSDARKLLAEAEAAIAVAEQALPPPTKLIVTVGADGVLASKPNGQSPDSTRLPARFKMEESSALALQGYYEAVLEFDYKPTGRGRLEIVSATDRPPTESGNFGVIADIKLLDAGEWRHARVRVFSANSTWRHRLDGGHDLEFRGEAEIRNLRLTATYRQGVRQAESK